MTTLVISLSAARRHRLRELATGAVARWQRARQLRETRRYIMEMDEHMLSDIGLSRAQALFEIDELRRREK